MSAWLYSIDSIKGVNVLSFITTILSYLILNMLHINKVVHNINVSINIDLTVTYHF